MRGPLSSHSLLARSADDDAFLSFWQPETPAMPRPLRSGSTGRPLRTLSSCVPLPLSVLLSLRLSVVDPDVSRTLQVEFFYRTHDPTTADRQGPDTGSRASLCFSSFQYLPLV